MTRPALAEHQRTGAEWINRVNRGLLGDEPGLGKTRTAITAFDGARVLVVAPSMVVASGVWASELDRWSDYPDRYVVTTFSMLNQRRKTEKGGTSPVPLVRPEYQGPWDALVVDEAHYTKGRRTSWTGAVEQIAKRCGSVLEMTGTPIPNWSHEIYTILRVLEPERAKPGNDLGSYWRWVERWFNVTTNPFGRNARKIGDLRACTVDCLRRTPSDPCSHYRSFVEHNLGDRFLQRMRDDVLPGLPPVTEQTIRVPMESIQRTHYRRLRDEYYTQVGDRGEQVVAWSPSALHILLDRVTTSHWLLDPTGEPKGGKLERLRFDLASRARPTLVLAHYRDTVEGCHKVALSVGARSGYIHGGVPSRQAGALIERFQSGALDVLVGSLETISEGVNLTAADMAIFVERSYKPSRNEQARRRIHRMGQTRPVTIYDYLTPGSLDEGKRRLLATKTDRQMRVLTAAHLLALT